MNILILISSFKNLEVLNIYYLLLPYFWMTIWFFSFSSSFILLSLPKPFRSSVWNANGPPTGGFLWRSGKVWSLSTTKSRRWGYEWGYYWDPFKWPKISWGNWGFILSSRFERCVFSVFVFSVLLIFVRGVMELNFLGSDMVVISASLGWWNGTKHLLLEVLFFIDHSKEWFGMGFPYGVTKTL